MSDYVENWVDGYLKPRYPELVAPYLRAKAVTAAALSTGAIAPKDLAVLERYCTDPRTVLSHNVADMLGQLAERIDAARLSILNLASSKLATVRIVSLVALCSFPSGLVHLNVVSKLLKDKSSKVRALAATRLLDCFVDQAVPELRAALTREKNARVAKSLQFCLDLLDPGYIVKTTEPGWVQITVRKRRGSIETRMYRAEHSDIKTIGRLAAEQKL